jgi:hypothetical protein
MKRIALLICFLALVAVSVSTVNLHAADAEPVGDRKFRFGLKVGGLLYAGFGDQGVTTPLYKIKFELDQFKIGFAGGIEGLYFPSPKHSLALGAEYEQRRIDLRIADLKILIPITIASPIPIPFLPDAISLYFLPVEDFVGKTAVSTHYINVPLIYRFHFHKYLYFGLGLNAAFIIRAIAEYSIVGFNLTMDLKSYYSIADLGANIMGGVTFRGAFIEFIGNVGMLNIDEFGGERRSICIKIMAGYRF